ncbi:MAG: DNA ligase [Rhodocyclaceae bacterium]|nr:DNA ligase [Rhodocyclaceae bacterium]
MKSIVFGPLLALVVLGVHVPVCRGAAQDPPDALLAREAEGDIDPSAYWVSEKLDGVRALWDGHRLWFRSGREIHAPDWFLAALPPQPLDGELWMGRGRFDAMSGLARRQDPTDPAWREVRYMVFELPEAPGPFSERLARLAEIVGRARVSWLHCVEQRRVPTRAALKQWLAQVLAAGGEGLMLHRADAPYLTGRSDVLLKLKPWHDAEAVVIGHLAGRGRLEGRVGALLVEDATGRRFRLGVGLTDAERDRPPPIGSEVSYRFRSRTPSGLPRHPVYWRIRTPAPAQSSPGSGGVGASSTSR